MQFFELRVYVVSDKGINVLRQLFLGENSMNTFSSALLDLFTCCKVLL